MTGWGGLMEFWVECPTHHRHKLKVSRLNALRIFKAPFWAP